MSSNGQITSLRYPYDFIGSPDCIYAILLKSGTFAKISVIDIQLDKTENCSENFLEIREGKDGYDSPFLERFCGEMHDLTKTSLQSKGPDVWIR